MRYRDAGGPLPPWQQSAVSRGKIGSMEHDAGGRTCTLQSKQRPTRRFYRELQPAFGLYCPRPLFSGWVQGHLRPNQSVPLGLSHDSNWSGSCWLKVTNDQQFSQQTAIAGANYTFLKVLLSRD
jgi:hypothetical protein